MNKNINNDFPTVLFVQRRLPHYRVPFFEALKDELFARGCNLRVLHGLPNQEELLKNDSGVLSWAESLPNRYFFGGKVCWQSFSRQSEGVDLVICSHENKLIFNLIFQYFYPRIKFALFGHGANLQGKPSSLREKFKRKAGKQADWWFGYTALSLPLIHRFGFPKERITIVNNAVDTQQLTYLFNRINDVERVAIRKKYAVKSHQVGIFIGSLYKEKCIDFMLDAIVKIKIEQPEFEMIIIGDGVQQDSVTDFCAEHPWAKYVGVCLGKEKVDLLAISTVMINPGLVGLGILDSFVCGVPMLTSDCGFHSPEIAYLNNGKNGLITEYSIDKYVSAVVKLLADPFLLLEMKKACLESAQDYNIQSMVVNFADGIMECLAKPLYRVNK